MKKLIVFLFILLYLFFEVIFFDISLSDFKTKKIKLEELKKKIEIYVENEDNVYLTREGYRIKNCPTYFKAKATGSNPYEEMILLNYKRKCDLWKLIKDAKTPEKSLIDGIDLMSIGKFSSELAVESCKTNDKQDEKIVSVEKRQSLKHLEEIGTIKIKIIDRDEILIERLLDGKIVHVKELGEADINYSFFAEKVLEIVVADKQKDKVECIKYVVYSKYNDDKLINKKTK